jgi:type VI secretion system secreted protein Hcp
MTIEAYLNIPDVTGDATHPEHFEEITLLGWDWGAHQPSSQTGRREGRLRMKNLSITKKLDGASVACLMKMNQNEILDPVILTNRKAGASATEFTSIKYFIITLSEARITSISRSAQNGVPEITETITLAYHKWTEEYAGQGRSGDRNAGMEAEIELGENS